MEQYTVPHTFHNIVEARLHLLIMLKQKLNMLYEQIYVPYVLN